MEYPMISFNVGRPEKDGTYSAQTKYNMMMVIIHEVGHNFFPMIINSDERQWSWMDEGLNSFVQYLTEQAWERNFPSPRYGPGVTAAYMRTDKSLQTPIMTNSESVLQFFNNAYAKPATDRCDISLEGVRAYQASTADPAVEKARAQQLQAAAVPSLSAQRNASAIKSTVIDEKPELKDFYNTYDPLAVTPADQQRYQAQLAALSPEQRQRLGDSRHFYELSLRNVGGLVMPVIVQLTYADNTTEVQTIPAEIWRKNNAQVTKIIVTKKPVISFVLDPFEQTVDTDVSNNAFPRQPAASRFELFEQQQPAAPNPMQSSAQTPGSPRQMQEPKPVGGSR
jgi:soluble cytochrome b562